MRKKSGCLWSRKSRFISRTTVLSTATWFAAGFALLSAALVMAVPAVAQGVAQGVDLAVTPGSGFQRAGDLSVQFSYRPTSPDPASITFVADAPEAELPFTCAWDIGGKEACGDTVTERLSEGTHTVKLSVTDSRGRTGTAALDFTVGQPEPLLAQTVGLFINDPRAWEGYTLFMPFFYTDTYLINNAGLQVHLWDNSATPAASTYLLENGHILRPQKIGNTVFTGGGTGGQILEVDWDGTVLWDYTYSTSLHCQHHDVERLPNGNTLMIAWEYKSQAEALAAGRHPSYVTSAGLWPDTIIEVQPTGPTSGTIVWEWHAWDHMIQAYDSSKANYGVISEHPELILINNIANGSSADFMHFNSIDYSQELDQILISADLYSEVWILDHSTTTAEAAGHTGGNCGKGGDLLYRWGNPYMYRRGTTADRKLFYQHDVQWIPEGCPGAGNITIFNNGNGRPDGNYSSIDEIAPPLLGDGNYYLAPGSTSMYGPTSLTWTYTGTPPSSWYNSAYAGAQRLPNGNTLITSGLSGTFFEVTYDTKETVWKYICPVTTAGPIAQGSSPMNNNVFKIRRYPPDFQGLAGRDLRPGCTVEIDACYPALRLAPADPGQAVAMLPLDPVRDLYTNIGATIFSIPNDASPTPPLIFYGIPDAATLDVTRSGSDVTLSFSL